MTYRTWGLVLSIVGIGIAAVTGIASVTIPEVRCFLRLEPCPIDKLVNVKLVLETEESKSLEGVEVFFIPSGLPPVIKRTNSDGYVKIKIPRTGDIDVKLSKNGYETLTRTINLSIEPDETKTYRLKKIVIVPPTPTISPTKDPTQPFTPGNTPDPPLLENTCIKKEGSDSEINSQAIIVGRTYQKPKRRIYIYKSGSYSATCTITKNTDSLNFIYALPDESPLEKVKILLYLDGKLSKSLEITRGSLVPLSLETKNANSYTIEYIVENSNMGYLYTSRE